MPLVTKELIIENTVMSSSDKIITNLIRVSATVNCAVISLVLQCLACNQLALNKWSCTPLADGITSKKNMSAMF